MRKLKNILAMVMVSILSLIIFSGCSGKEKDKAGRYIEEDYSLPDGISYIADIRLLKDNSLIMLANKEIPEENRNENSLPLGSLKYFISLDLGKTWNEEDLKLSEKNGDNVIAYTEGIITEEGKVILSSEEYTKEDIEAINNKFLSQEKSEEKIHGNKKWIIADKNGNIEEIEDSDKLKDCNSIKSDNNGNIYFVSEDCSKIFQADIKRGKIKNTFENETEDIRDFIIINNILIVNNYDEAIKYNIENGEKEGNIEALNKSSFYGDNYFNSNEDKKIYIINSVGLSEYTLGDKKTKNIIDSNMLNLKNNKYYLQSFLEIGKEGFLGVFLDMEENKTILKHYYFSTDVSNKIDNEITIYSIYENEFIKQSIAKYQKEHSDLYIKYEVGIKLDDSTTKVEDALKLLNIEIMSGKGPDIIDLSSLEIRPYIEKGLLDDISEITAKLNKDEIFTNILNTKSKDNKVYAVPINFSIPIIINKTDRDIKNLNSLANEAKSIKKSYNGDITSAIEADETLYYFYEACGTEILNADKSLNKEALKEYLICIKSIYDEEKDTHTNYAINKHEENIKMFQQIRGNSNWNFAKVMYSNKNYLDSALENSPIINVCDVYSVRDMVYINSFKKNYNINFSAWKGMGEGKVIPNTLLGLSSKSNNKDIAKIFIGDLLTEKYQSINNNLNISVNKKVVKEGLTDKNMLNSIAEPELDNENGSILELKYEELTDEEVENLLSIIESYSGWDTVDNIVMEKSITEMNSFVEGKTSLEDTVSAIEEKINIYLEE